MNLILGELPDRLAAEYVLGTLAGGARRRFDALLPAHPALRGAVAAWEARLLPMALKAEPIAPPNAVWDGIESRLGWQANAAGASAAAASATAARGPLTGKLRFWRAFSALASLVALMLALLMRLAPVGAPTIVVLRATSGNETLVAGVSPDHQRISIQPLQPVSLASERSLELWALKKAGAPLSLGVISPKGLTAVSHGSLPKDTKGLAVTLEPLGGSPTGAPTGPVLFVGDLTL